MAARQPDHALRLTAMSASSGATVAFGIAIIAALVARVPLLAGFFVVCTATTGSASVLLARLCLTISWLADDNPRPSERPVGLDRSSDPHPDGRRR